MIASSEESTMAARRLACAPTFSLSLSGDLLIGDFDCVDQYSFYFSFEIAQGLVNEVEI